MPVGAAVTVTVPARPLLLGALLVYGLPLAAMLLGAGAAAAILGSELGAAVGAAAGLAAALVATTLLEKRLERAIVRGLVVQPIG